MAMTFLERIQELRPALTEAEICSELSKLFPFFPPERYRECLQVPYAYPREDRIGAYDLPYWFVYHVARLMGIRMERLMGDVLLDPANFPIDLPPSRDDEPSALIKVGNLELKLVPDISFEVVHYVCAECGKTKELSRIAKFRGKYYVCPRCALRAKERRELPEEC
jgi:predicted RNA-binding Zn-ribbon protein involved in translation (DUF1610 family)